MSKHITKKALKNISDKCGFPLDVTIKSPMIQIFSDREIIVENAKKIEYHDENISKIRTSDMLVCICGKKLKIKFLENKNVSVSGYLEKITFE
jgi:sporulation protein YqfC